MSLERLLNFYDYDIIEHEPTRTRVGARSIREVYDTAVLLDRAFIYEGDVLYTHNARSQKSWIDIVGVPDEDFSIPGKMSGWSNLYKNELTEEEEIKLERRGVDHLLFKAHREIKKRFDLKDAPRVDYSWELRKFVVEIPTNMDFERGRDAMDRFDEWSISEHDGYLDALVFDARFR